MRKKFTLLIAALALLTMIVQPLKAVGQTTVSQTNFSSVSGTSLDDDENVSYTSHKGGGTSNPAISSNCIRLYQKTGGGLGGYIVIGVADGYVITSISITPNAVTKAGYMLTDEDPGDTTPSVDDFVETDHACSSGTAYGVSDISSRYVVFGNFGDSNSNSTRRLDIKTISVTYTTSGGGGSTVAAPSISPANNSAVALTDNIEMTCSTEGAAIYYNINSDDAPTSSSSQYTAAFNLTADDFVNNSCTVKAIAIKDNVSSDVTTRTYTRAQVAEPTISPVAGTYYGTQEVTLSCATTGATIYYTTNGDAPTTTSSTYSDPFNIEASCTVKAIAAKNGYLVSEIAEASYVIEAGYETIFSQDWEDEQMHNWTFVSVEGDQEWSISSYNNNHFAKMSGYSSGNHANVDWVISPAFNLNNWNNALLSFTSARSNHDGEVLKVYFSNDYNGSTPATATWTELSCTLPTKPNSGYSNFVSSGDIDLSSYSGTNCYIGFKYTSTTSAAATWEVDDILLVGQENTTPMITADLSAMSFTYEAGASGSAASQALAIEGSNLTAAIAATITQGADKFSISDDEETWATSLSLPLAGDVIAVRLNPGITTPGTYNGTITLTSTGADPVTVNLTGTVTTHLYSVLLSQPATGGTIGADKETAQEGETVTLSYTANAGFVFGSWAVEDEDENPITVDANNQFTMPASDVIVTATFNALPTYAITTVAEPAAGGTVVTDETAWEGKEVTVLVEANEGYALETLTATYVDGESVSHDLTITNNIFVMPAYSVTVTATFVVNLNVTYDFTNLDNFFTDNTYETHPTAGTGNSHTNVGTLYYNNSTHDQFTASGTDYYFNSGGYFMLGKSGALFNLPTFENYIITKVIIHSSASHSTAVNVAIVNGSNVVAAAQEWGTTDTDYTYDIPQGYQTSALSIKVTTSNNTQFTSITLVRESPSTDPSITADDVVNIDSDATGGTISYTINNPVDGATLTASVAAGATISNLVLGSAGATSMSFTCNANSEDVVHTATVTLSYEKNSTVLASKTITINQAAYVPPFAPVLYTRATSITSGQHYIIVGFDNDGNAYAMGEQKSNNRGAVLISEDGTYATVINEEVYDFVIASEEGYYSIYDAVNTGYLYAASNTKNYLMTESDLSDNSKWEITFNTTTSAASVVATESNNRNVMQFNCTGTTRVFACYSSASQTSVYLYVKSGETPASNSLTVTSTDFDDDGGYCLIASPFNGLNPATIEGMTDGFDLYYFDQAEENEWRNYKAAAFNLESGKGYLYAKSGTGDVTFNFYGKAYNGDGEIHLAYSDDNPLEGMRGWNLIGNPFTNSATLDKPYYRLNNAGSALITSTESTSVAAMEGVFVKATEAGQTAQFTAQSRGGSQAIAKAEISVIGSRGTVVDNAIVRFDNGETLEKFIFGNPAANIYFAQDGKEYAIVRSDAQGEMPVNFKAAENGTYTISVEAENLDVEYLHLIDNMTGANVDLLATPSYTFEARKSDYASRFRLLFSANAGNNEVDDDFAFVSDGNIVISNEGEATLQVIDMLGRVISTQSVNGSASIENVGVAGVYVLRLVNGNNVKTQRIVVR